MLKPGQLRPDHPHLAPNPLLPDGISLGQMFGDFGQGYGIPPQFRGQKMGALDGTVGDNNPTDTILAQMTGGKFDSFTCANE